MRIVQTFWAGTNNPLVDSFGWYSPEYHIVAWALSCLRLKEFYDEVFLYTDATGLNIFKEILGLPYTDIYVEYENLSSINNSLWALPKILTYKKQEVPFIHVDGDIFIQKKFPERLERGSLIAQNREKVTNYYKNIIKGILKYINWVPDILNEPLYTLSFNSFNAGLIGGSDNFFFKEMSELAEEIVEKNKDSKIALSQNFNLLFEQILFAELAGNRKKKIVCYFDQMINDNRYSEAQFCNISLERPSSNFVHLIGEKKGNLNLCQSIGFLLNRDYPEYYEKIQEYFKKETQKRNFVNDIEKKDYMANGLHSIRLDSLDSSKARSSNFSDLSTSGNKKSQLDINDDFLNDYNIVKTNLNIHFHEIDINYLREIMTNSIKGDFFSLSKEKRVKLKIVKNRYVHIVDESFDWPIEVKRKINNGLLSPNASENMGLLLVPDMLLCGYVEICISELDYNIFKLLEKPIQFSEIITAILETFVDSREDVLKIIVDLINFSLDNMSQLNLIYFEDE